MFFCVYFFFFFLKNDSLLLIFFILIRFLNRFWWDFFCLELCIVWGILVILGFVMWLLCIWFCRYGMGGFLCWFNISFWISDEFKLLLNECRRLFNRGGFFCLLFILNFLLLYTSLFSDILSFLLFRLWVFFSAIGLRFWWIGSIVLFFVRLTFNSLIGGGVLFLDGDMRIKVFVVDFEVVMFGRLY